MLFELPKSFVSLSPESLSVSPARHPRSIHRLSLPFIFNAVISFALTTGTERFGQNAAEQEKGGENNKENLMSLVWPLRVVMWVCVCAPNEKEMYKLPFKWPTSLVIWWRRRNIIIATVAVNENSSKTIDINTMNQGSCSIFCGCLRWWWWSSKLFPVPLGWARGGVIKWLGSIINDT